jgi:hypothetical protein
MKEILKESIGLIAFIAFMAFCIYELSLIDDELVTSQPLIPTIQLKVTDNKIDTLYIYKIN